MTGNNYTFPTIGMARHRIGIDGYGVTTLVCAYGCPLRCKMCLNPHSFRENTKIQRYTVEELYDRGIANGISGLQILNRAELLKKLPSITDNIFIPQMGLPAGLGFSNFGTNFYPSPGYMNQNFEQYSNGPFSQGWGMSNHNYGTGSSVRILD